MDKNAIQKITEKAERLRLLREEIGHIKEEQKKILEPFEIERDNVQQELLSDLKSNDLKSIKVASGETFSMVSKPHIVVVNEVFAMPWALEHRTVRIDSVLVNQKLKDAEDLPVGFAKEVTEYIVVKAAPKKEEPHE